MKKMIFSTILFFTAFMVKSQVALNFDGFNDYVQTEYLGVTGNGARTIEVWFNRDIATTSQGIIAENGQPDGPGTRFTFKVQNNHLRVEIGGPGLSLEGTTYLSSDQWYHGAVVFDPSLSTNQYKLYLDGILEAEGDFAGINTNTIGNLQIGGRNNEVGIFDGTLDDLRYWSVARTQQEIADNMNEELCSLPPELGAYFKFNEGTPDVNNSSISTLLDEVSPGNNNTLNNFGLTSSFGYSNYVSGNVTGSLDLNITEVTSCEDYTWSEDGNTYTTSGVYDVVYTNIEGCDSIERLDLTIPTIDNTVTQNTNGTVSADQAGAEYQWLDCDNNDSPINNATSQAYLSSFNGNVAVEIDIDGCLDTSACIAVTANTNDNTALALDGVDDYVETNIAGVSGNGARTVEVWVKVPVNNPNSQSVLVDWGTFATSSRSTFNVLNQKLRLEVAGGGINANTEINDGQWHHVAYTYDPNDNDTVRFYIDGIQDAAGQISNVSINTGTDETIRIGKRIDDNNLLNGEIDEVRVWDVARSASEIANNINDEFCTVPDNMIAYFRFNKGIPFGNNAGIQNETDYISFDTLSATLTGLELDGSSSNYVVGPLLGEGYQYSFVQMVECGEFTWTLDGNTYNSSQLVEATVTTQNGCDSLVFLDLTVNETFSFSETITACEEYVWAEDGNTYNTSGQYTVSYTTLNGCDSTYMIDLTINASEETVLTESACNSYTWDENGSTYTSSGLYQVVLLNQAGCDSIITLDLTINTFMATVMNNGDGSFTADQGGLTYQWLNCENSTVINNETDQTFTPIENGQYAVIVDNGTCVDTTECITINNVGLEEQELSSISLYPNPTSDIFHIDGSFQEIDNVRIFNSVGKEIRFKTIDSSSFDLPDYNSGVYIVQITMSNGSVYTRKLIKK